MAAASADTRASFLGELSAALEIAGKSTAGKTRKAENATFQRWREFCSEFDKSPTLDDVPDQDTKLLYLIVFGRRYRLGSITGHDSVRGATVEKALLAVGKGFTNLGRPDPRKQTGNADRYHPLLAAFLKTLKDQDDPSTRAYPANISLLRELPTALDFNNTYLGEFNRHVADLIVAAFYFLLRPGEYCLSTSTMDPESRTSPFRFRDLSIHIDGQPYPAVTAPLNDETVRTRVTHATLTFTDQKNAVRGETISHNSTDDPFVCPAKALARVARRLQKGSAYPDTPLYEFCRLLDNARLFVRPEFIKNALRIAAGPLSASTGIQPNLLTARSLRPGGATASLCAQIDPSTVQLVSRWKSDAMLRYLRAQATTTSMNLAQRMLDHGTYTFAPGTYNAGAYSLPAQAPAGTDAALRHLELSITVLDDEDGDTS